MRFHLYSARNIASAGRIHKEGRPQLQLKHVDSPPGALDETTKWIEESVNEELLSLSETALTPGAESSSKPSLSPTLVLNNSYLKLLQWDYQKKELPEVCEYFCLPQIFQYLTSNLECHKPVCVTCVFMILLKTNQRGSLYMALLLLHFHGIELPFLFLHFK